jgi:NADH dehydrogenase (ubiquinone) 1 alpha/beta subcomplex 1
MALLGALHTLRSSLLARVSLPLSRVPAVSVGAAASLSLVRGFAESTYLDKHVVTDRVLEVVKNFDKVDPSKVGTPRLTSMI